MFFSKKVYINNKESFLKSAGAGYFLTYIAENPHWRANIVDNIEEADISLIAVKSENFDKIPKKQKVIARLDNIDKNHFEGTKQLFERADRIIYQTNYSKEINEKAFGKTKVPYTIIPNGAPLNLVNSRESFDQRIVIASIGTWANILPMLPYYEGSPKADDLMYDLINYAPKLFEKYPKLEWRIIGDYLPQEFVDLLNKYPQNLTHMGTLNRSDLFASLHSTHVLYHPGRNDNCPNAVVEALVTGIPVIYYKSGGVPDLVDHAGISIEPRNEKQFFSAFDEILTSYQSFHSKALKRSSFLSIQNIAKLYWKFIFKWWI